MPIPEGNITDKDVDNVLANLDEIFAPGQLNHSDQINEKEKFPTNYRETIFFLKDWFCYSRN